MKTLLLLCICLQEPEALIRDLSSDDLEVRDKAAAGLVKLGEPALEAMKKALAKADGEGRARLQDVIATIERDVRRKKFKGGDEVCGFVAALRSEKDAFKVGEAITLKLEIMNVTGETRAFTKGQQFDRAFPTEGSSITSSHGLIAVKQLTGVKPDTVRHMMGCGTGPDKATADVKSGASIALDIALGDKLVAGEYEVTVTYYAKSKELLDKATAELVTNVLKFKIE